LQGREDGAVIMSIVAGVSTADRAQNKW